MREHFVDLLRKIDHHVALQSGYVERAVDEAIHAYLNRDVGAATAIVKGDAEINRAEVELERLCLDTIALQHPLASDLRLVAGALKINNDLERIADLACSVSKRVGQLSEVPVAAYGQRLESLGQHVLGMLRRAIDALVRRDCDLAREVWHSDEVADRRFRDLLEVCFDIMRAGALPVEEATNHVVVARSVERMGDHAKNIAEEVLFVVEGAIVRHEIEAPVVRGRSPPS